MTRSSIPPLPFNGDLERWARDLVAYLQDRDRAYDEAQPTPVALSHQVGGERALQDGVLMYRPTVGPVVSVQGSWVPLYAEESVDWDGITDKPTVFPPAPHTHLEADITNLDKYTQAQVDAKISVVDNTIQNVRQKLNAHTNDENNPHKTSWANLIGVPSNFPPAPHTHVVADITDIDSITEAVMQNLDAFGRLRVSNPLTLFSSKQLFDNKPFYWDDQEITGSGTSSTFSAARASTIIGVTASTAGKRVRQTYQRFDYQPGKSQLVLCTGILMASGVGAGITSAMGLFDGNNGVFTEFSDGVLNFTIRSSVSGSVVDNIVTQDNWNGDKLDGTGTSGHTLDMTKTQIMWLDLEWLGVGTVRCGYVIDGEFILCHAFNHANSETSVYMSTPNLPVRYEISNDGTGSAATLEHICATVMSEGGVDRVGEMHYESTSGTHIDADIAGTVYACIGVRLKPTYLGQQIDFVAVSILNTTNDDFEWLVLWNPTVAGTFTYSDKTNTSVQTATGTTANTVTGGTVLGGGFVKASASSGSTRTEITNALHLGAAIDGTLDEIVLCVRPLSANADIEASVTWRETT